MQAAPLPPIYLDIHEGRPASAPETASGSQGEAWVQLGAWRTRRKAGEVLRAARALSPADAPPPVRIFPARARGRLWWRVVAGPFAPQAGYDLCGRVTPQGYECVTHEEPFPLGTSRRRHRPRGPAH